MTDDASQEAAGATAGRQADSSPAAAGFAVREVPPPTQEERQARRDAMARAVRFGATPYRDADGRTRHVRFKEANNAPVRAWTREPAARRGFRRVQEARKAAGQLIGHPEDQIELAKRLGALYHREGRSAEGAAERGLLDAIWRYEHVWDTFTVPRRLGRESIDSGRVAAVAEEEARKLRVEDPGAVGGFWVRDRKNNGLVYVVPNPEPPVEAAAISGGDDEAVLVGQASPPPSQVPQAPTTANGYFALLRRNLAPREGGRANRPRHQDPAGKTNKGVTQGILDDLRQYKPAEYGHYPTDVFLLNDNQIDTILRREFFDPLHTWEVAQIPNLLRRAPQLPDQLFDIAVLHGVGFAGRVLQEALADVMGIDLRVAKNGKLDYDGIIGPATRKAIAQTVAAGRIVELNDLIVDKRIAELNTKGHKQSNPGWFSRAESFRIAPAMPKGQGGTP